MASCARNWKDTLEPSLFRYAWHHSKREQFLVFGLILLSLPFNWISFEIPKRIVNDAIQGRAFKDGQGTARLFGWVWSLPDFIGGGTLFNLPGIDLTQINYLFTLSALFLLFVLINGWFKYAVNIRKGILGERMLRRLRFDLFQQLMRFRPEDMRAVKPAEVASMIKDEVDPIGGFIGDAFIQPVFLATQAITPLLFIFFQNIMLGVVALAIVLVQGIVIPRLRVEQLRLARQRQLLSRQLAGRIGDIVEGAPVIHAHNTIAYNGAEIGNRLGTLYTIRVDLFRRKFSVKYLNNLLAQITPFFFYAIGGYFALKKQLDIGQLVAVIAAYRDLPPPIKDLIDWDQERNDVTIKYEQVVAQFSPAKLLPQEAELQSSPGPADIAIQGLRVTDGRGNLLLDRLSATLLKGTHIAIAGRGPAADTFMKVLGRQISDYQGRVEIGGQNIAAMAEASFAARLAYVGPDAPLAQGSIRDNIVVSLQRAVPASGNDNVPPNLPAKERLRLEEARRTGNPLAAENADWVDYAAAGASGPDGLDDAIRATLEALGSDTDIYRLGIFGLLGEKVAPEVAEQFVGARHVMRARMDLDHLNRLVEPFDPSLYNNASTIAENLLFGVPRGETLATGNLAQDPYVRSILRSEALAQPLAEMGLRIARWTVDTFGALKTMPKLADRFALFNDEDPESLARLVNAIDTRSGLEFAPDDIRNRLISFALLYIEPQHRLGLLDVDFKARVVRARDSFKRFLPRDYQDAIEFYHPDRFNHSAPILDNLLFGRVAAGVGNAEKRIASLCQVVLRQQGLDRTLFRIGLDRPVGLRGRYVTPRLRSLIDISRSLIRRPDILVLDNPLGGMPAPEAIDILTRIRASMQGRLLVVTLPETMDPGEFDRVISFAGTAMSADAAGGVPQDETRLAIPAE